MNYLLGADPEIFVKRNGVLQSAFGLIPGTKAVPHAVDRGAVQVDGMALEFNIAPAASANEFSLNIKTVMQQLRAMVPDYELAIQPVANFGHEYMATQPDEARELGCDPDYNAYTGQANDRPDGDRPFRTAAGHLHIGWCEGADIKDPVHIADCEAVVKMLDWYLGVPSVLLDPDVQRRELYGKAGAYRPKSYGVEYRVLSNFWLKSDALIEWAYTQTMAAMQALESGYTPSNSVPLIINRSDVTMAKRYVSGKGWRLPNV